jgi:chaperone modulatory protein CbpM
MSTTVMRVTVTELCERDEVSREALFELVQHEVVEPIEGSSVDDWCFDVSSAHWLKRALRLKRDLDIDWVAVAMLIDLLREREALAQENQCLRQRLDRFLLESER